MSPRWKKVMGDLRSSPIRTLLVVLSIFIGVFAVGAVLGTEAIVVREMNTQYRSANPANATISVPEENSFGIDFIRLIRTMDGVGAAEGRRSYGARVQVPAGDWRDISVIAIDDFDTIQINRFQLIAGTSPPPQREILIERSGLELLALQVGDMLILERPDGRQRTLRIAGTVYDPTQAPAVFAGVRGYVTPVTMEWLSGTSQNFNQLLIVSAENRDNFEHNQAVARTVYERLQRSGRDPSFPLVSDGQHPLNTFISAMVAILGAMGVMAVLLSGFLVTNTIAALLAQQTKQIGIMKSIGARSTQITLMYIVLVLCFGLVAMILAYPLAIIVARVFASAIATFFNFDLVDTGIPAYVILIQLTISLIVPLLAALYPVIRGTRLTVRDALDSASGSGYDGGNVIDRLFQRIRGLPRPMLFALRNTFRRKGRVILTLLTLTLGGAIFISIFSVRDSLMLTLDNIIASLFNYDVAISFQRGYREELVINEAQRIPGVVAVEPWNISSTRRIRPDNTESATITLWAVPPDSQMVRPTLIEGRWLLPGDQNAIVVSAGVLQNEPDVHVGDEIVLNIRGRDTTWRVVGQVVTIGAVPWAYVSYDVYARVARQMGSVSSLYLQTEPRTGAMQDQVARVLEDHLSSLGVNVSGTETGARIRADNETFFNVLIAVLLGMALLIAVVGGLGLTGTMSLNVLERTREIGVMRAIGASDRTVLQVVMVEGIVLGLLSWLLGAAISFPASIFLSQQIGRLLFTFPLDFLFSIQGALIWLVVSLVLAAVASFFPAWNAARVTVRDVLAYE